ncbi:MAG: TetR family transcriptional regulator [Marmoricola sp.]
MPRIAEGRPPAEPTTELQRDRCERMLTAAARLGALHGFEHVQMQEVAAEAGVAIGTLYRYYPSKHQLFAGLMNRNLAALRRAGTTAATADPASAVGDLVARACTDMLRHPLLARAMIHSVNAVRSEHGGAADTTLRDRILEVAGISEPSDDDLRLARLVDQCAYGVLTWAVAGETSPADAVTDLRRACDLLLEPWSRR